MKRIEIVLLVSFLAFITVPLLYILRFLDDNTLTSWRWVFSAGGIGPMLPPLAAGILFSAALSRITRPERVPALFLFIVSFVAMLPLWSMPEVILDASRYFLQAKHVELYGSRYFYRHWGGSILAWTDLPLIPYLYGLIFRYLGEVRAHVQFVTTLFFSATTVVTYLIGKTLWDRERGLYGGLFLLGISYLYTQPPLMLVDVPTMFFMTLSIYTFLKVLERGGIGWIAAASGAVALTLLTKYSTWLMLFVLPLILLLYHPNGYGRSFRRATIVLGIVGMLCLPVLLTKYDVIARQVQLLSTYQWEGLRRWSESLASTFFFQVHPFVTLLAAYALFAAFRRRDRLFLIAGWFVLFNVLVSPGRIRYMIPLFPLFTLMASYGLNEIQDRPVRRFVCYTVVVSSLLIAVKAFLPFLNTVSLTNLREAGAFLDTLTAEEIEVIPEPQADSSGNTEFAIPLLDLFTNKKLVYRREPPPRPPAEEVDRSSLRFTWEFKPPPFYRLQGDDQNLPRAVISSEIIDEGRDGMRTEEGGMLRSFSTASGAFHYRTFVTVFVPGHLSQTEQH